MPEIFLVIAIILFIIHFFQVAGKKGQLKRARAYVFLEEFYVSFDPILAQRKADKISLNEAIAQRSYYTQAVDRYYGNDKELLTRAYLCGFKDDNI